MRCSDLHIDWYAPADESRSEIARYSSGVMTELLHRVGELSSGIASGCDETGRDLKGLSSLPVYHLGNSAVHVPILKQAMRRPGLVVLHDLNLIDLARAYAAELGDQGWVKRAESLHQSSADSRSPGDTSDVHSIESVGSHLYLPMIGNALAVIVHSDYAADCIERDFPGRFRLHRLNLPASPSREPFTDERAGAPFGIICCGHMGPNRRILPFIEAWGACCEPESFRLTLYGHVSHQAEIFREARRVGVADFLHVEGYVDEPELLAACQRAHLALNLRWPSMGEASASQLLYWSQALPTIVTATGWYEEQPDNAVLKIDPRSERQALTSVLDKIVSRELDLPAYARNGLELVASRHSINSYCEDMCRIFLECAKQAAVKGFLGGSFVDRLLEQCADPSHIGLFDTVVDRTIDTLGSDL